VLSYIDDILVALKSGEWHNLKEISKMTRLPERKVKLLANFLAEYDFVELDKEEQQIRLTHSLFDFLSRIQSVEKKEGAVTL